MALNHHTKSKRVKYDEEVSLDRFTELPDAIIHHIFSFLDENEMFRTLILSKRCLDLCFSSPYINFSSRAEGPQEKYFSNFVDRHIFNLYRNPNHNNHSRYRNPCDKSSCKSFKSFLGNFMSKHGNNEVDFFRLNWFGQDCPCYANRESLMDEWLYQLATCNVRELSLDIDLTTQDSTNTQLAAWNRKSFELSDCKFLRVLEIDLHNDIITLPSRVFACLEILSLNAACFNNRRCSVGKWISKYCPSLKKLSLVSLPETLSLQNDSLTDVTIVTTSLTSVSVASENLRALSIYFPRTKGYNHNSVKDETYVKISAPNLRVLNWEGCLPQEITISKLLLLTEATLHTSRPQKPGKDTLRPLDNLLVCARSAKVLRLDISVIEAMFVRYDVPAGFENLHRLEIINCSGDTYEGCHIPLMAYFMSRMPKLRFLAIDCGKKNDNIYTNWADREMPPLLKSVIKEYESFDYLIHQCRVKEVEIRLSDESMTSANGIMLAIYFLEAIFNLEKMTIVYPLSFYDELPAFVAKARIASSQVTVVTMVDNRGNIQ